MHKRSEPTFLYALRQGYRVLEQHAEQIAQYAQVQNQTLLEILRNNAATEYGQLCHFHAISGPDSYASQVPLSTYRVYRPYVQRMLKDGSKNLLFADELSGWASTSATSGAIKWIPQTCSMEAYFIRDYVLRGLALADREAVRKTGQHLQDGSLLVLTGNPARYDRRKSDQKDIPISSVGALSILMSEVSMHALSVVPVRLLTDLADSATEFYYLYLRFALTCRDLVYACSIYDDYILGLLRYLERNRDMLCDEIEQGTYRIKAFDPTDESMKPYLRLLGPDPERAEELRTILASGIKQDSLHRIWPKLQVVSAAGKVGSFLNDSGLNDYLDGIAYDASPYGATECMMGVAAGLNDNRIRLLPHICYFEFIPIEATAEEQPEILTMEQLENQKVYELVITTRAGLYRYRIGDRLRMVGSQNGCPLFRFEGRTGIGIDLVSEKAPEAALRNALIVAAIRCGVALTGSSMYGEGERFPGDGTSTLHYVVQFEAKKECTQDALAEFAAEIDHQISCIVKTYGAERKSGTLQPLQVEQLPQGTYQAYDTRAREACPNPAQYKRPFILKMQF